VALQNNKNSDSHFQSHAATYSSFVRIATVGTFACINIVLCLMLHAFGDGALVKWIIGVAGLIPVLIAAGIGIAIPSASWRPSAILMIGLGLVAIFAFAG
jgi:hypothetical protein